MGQINIFLKCTEQYRNADLVDETPDGPITYGQKMPSLLSQLQMRSVDFIDGTRGVIFYCPYSMRKRDFIIHMEGNKQIYAHFVGTD